MIHVNRQTCQIQSMDHFINTFNETVKDRIKLNELYHKSYAQLYQDVFVLWYLNFKDNGYFVDFGATNGVEISNTYMLEKDFNWQGIVAEPAKVWHKELKNNRNCYIDTNCVWNVSNQTIMFDEGSNSEWSCISEFVSDESRIMRGNSNEYSVNTISLNDLLEKYNAPTEIDYISLDTEGSELTILEAFDFSKYTVKFITCEHNDETEIKGYRNAIYSLLSSKGYDRIWTHLSAQDDWYVLKELNNK